MMSFAHNPLGRRGHDFSRGSRRPSFARGGALIAAILVGIGCSVSEQRGTPELIRRWERAGHQGEILFKSGGSFIGSGPDFACVLRLPSRKLEILTDEAGNRINANGAYWGRSTNEILLTDLDDRPGVHLMNRTSRKIELLIPEAHQPRRDTLVVTRSVPGHKWESLVPLPFIQEAYDFCEYGAVTGLLYAVKATWEQRWMEAEEQRWEVLRFDHAGNVAVLIRDDNNRGSKRRGLTLSPDESLLAFSNGVDILIQSLATGESIVPGRQPSTDLRDPQFAPDGSKIAAVGIDSLKGALGNAIFVASGPDFTRFDLLVEAPSGPAYSPKWTADGKWIIFSMRRPRTWDICDLWVVEVSTGEKFMIPWPYLRDDKEDKQVYIDGAIDWIE